MTQELLGRVHRELLDVLNSINQDKIHHDGDDFHELLNDVEKALAQPKQALCDLAEDGVCETLGCPNHPIGQEPVTIVTSETGANITMSWWHEPPLPVGTKLYTSPPQRTWVGLMRGVRVEGDTVVISVKGGNDAARELCGALIEEKNT